MNTFYVQDVGIQGQVWYDPGFQMLYRVVRETNSKLPHVLV